MNLLQVKLILKELKTIGFQLPNGDLVPKHFHVTEVGKITKHFIDCGGTVRNEEMVNFQLWNANDYDHRLHPEKLLEIIELSENKLGIDENLEVEVEYQGQSIEKYGLDFEGKNFLLSSKRTDCLAKDRCGIPTGNAKIEELPIDEEPCCSPDGNCC